MAEQKSDSTQSETDATEGTPTQHSTPQVDARLLINRHYIKDLSYENPNAPAIFGLRKTPDIKVNIDVKGTRHKERVFEVVLSFKIKATIEDTTAFLIELDFAALVKVGDKVEEADVEPILSVEVPRHLFPFARNVVADVSRDGGYPPLLINPVDFEVLREQSIKAAAAETDTASA